MAQRSPSSSPSEEALRDLLGFVRAIYRARQAEGVSRLELRRIEGVGRGLARAMAGGSPEEAEAAARAVSDIVGPLDAAEPVIRAAQAAIRERRGG